MFGASSELASVMEFGFNYVEAVAKVFISLITSSRKDDFGASCE